MWDSVQEGSEEQISLRMSARGVQEPRGHHGMGHFALMAILQIRFVVVSQWVGAVPRARNPRLLLASQDTLQSVR